MSLARKAAGSLVWVSVASALARVVTIGSTFVLTRFLAPSVQGEVNLAFVLVTTVGMATALGVAQYLAAHPKEGPDTAFHGSVLVLGIGVIACLGCVAGAGAGARLMGVRGMEAYVPGLALAHFIERCSWMPRALLVRDMRFRTLGLRVAVGEISFAASSVGLAYLGLGGDAIVGGNLVRAAAGLVFMMAVTDVRDYLSPCALHAATFRRILAFGLPLTISQFFRLGATTWDNSLMGLRFGESMVGIYNQAYRLAELPATALGDPSNDVLVPTFSRLETQSARRAAFLRAASLLALLIFPMACGLGVIAPTLVEAFYPPAYAEVAPFLMALAPLSIARAFTSLSGAFLQVRGRTRSFIAIDAGLVVTVLGAMRGLSTWGAVPSSLGVAIGFTASLVLTLRALRPEGILLTAVLGAVGRPFLACAPMIAAVVALRVGLRAAGVHAPLRLPAEVAAGALAYAVTVLVAAPALTRDFLALAESVIRRRASSSPPPG